ncbi:ABC transporter substrate-binding protein [Planosporangium flavigriseum]|uniref:ABC transporter substrate-binding protein n=1 Tax=Planosporangium flavigriseum TaxID=373681 RepID=A0A8J3LPJ0_9ACTN|nr:penicillin-binding protein activator [Planosporangium flavigriseum]NJC63117.1 ABC transporter substrate-binding protein [Planosporangium flavigriseum]GIG74495.1 ABC transporter substrate-binding protein [Planosporangium flavigriseum]
MPRIERRLRVGLAVTAALVVAATSACASKAGGSTSDPIKVAHPLPLTGVYAANGKDLQSGFEIGLKEFGSEVNGRKIEVTFADTQGDPATALTTVRKLIQDGAQVVQGPMATNEIAAVAPLLAQNGIPVNDLGLCSAAQLDSWAKTGNGFTSGYSCDQTALVAAEWAYNEMKWRHITLPALDYSWGWATAGGFKSAFEKLGGKIDKEIWIPNTAADLSSYVTQIPKDTDAVFAAVAGAFSVKFINAYKSFGLTGKIPVFGVTPLIDGSILPTMDPAATEGVYAGAQYCDGIDTPENKKFVETYHAANKRYPGYYAEAAYVRAQVLVSALKARNGDASDHKAMAKAMKQVTINAPRGPVSISDKSFSPIQNIYICQVKMVNGELRSIPIKTYEKVPPQGNVLDYATWEKNFKRYTQARP